MSEKLYCQQANDSGARTSRDTGLSVLMRDEFKYDPATKARADAKVANKTIRPSADTSGTSNKITDTSATGGGTNHTDANEKELIVEMEPYIVSAKRDRAIQKQIDRLDTLIAKAERHVEPSTLDTVLNSPKINIPILGGYAYEVRSKIVKGQIDEMRFIRQILVGMQAAKTLAEYKRYESMVNSMGVSVRISLPKFSDNESTHKQLDSGATRSAYIETNLGATEGANVLRPAKADMQAHTPPKANGTDTPRSTGSPAKQSVDTPF